MTKRGAPDQVNHGPLDPALEQESHFWGTVTRLLLDSGAIPYDVDRHRAAKIRDSEVLLRLGSRRADPEIEERWRGSFADRTIALLESVGVRQVLELGCGAGWLTLDMARRGLAVDAVDLSEERVEIGREYYRERSRHEELAPVRYEVRNIEVLEPGPGTYDAIVSFTTLHHIRGKQRLVRRCYQALPEGGRFIVFDDEHESGPWVWRGFRGLTVLVLALLLLPLPSPVPRRRRLLEAAAPLVSSLLSTQMRQRLRSLASPILWRGEGSGAVAKGAPFEGVHDDHHASLHDLFRSIFDEVQVERGELFGLRNLLVLDVPRPLRALLTRLLYALDHPIAGSARFPGIATYLVATKRTS